MSSENIINSQTLEIRSSPTFAVGNAAQKRKEDGLEVVNLGVGEPAEPPPLYVAKALLEKFKGLYPELKGINLQEIVPETMRMLEATLPNLSDKLAYALTDEDRATKARSGELYKYSAVGGMAALRKAIAEKFARENDLTYAPSQVMVTSGGKHAIDNAFRATLRPGDEVLIANPSWVSYEDDVRLNGGTPIGVRTDKNHKITPDTLKAVLKQHPNATWLPINSPSNPTGAVYSKAELQGLADVVDEENLKRAAQGRRPLMVMSDIIYEHMVYEDDYRSEKKVAYNIINACDDPAQRDRIQQHTLIVDGLAKSSSMTGWRLGYAAGPKELVEALEKLQGTSTSGISTITQAAALEALTNVPEREAHLERQRALYRKRRDTIEKAVKAIPELEYTPQPGAFYAWIDCSKLKGSVTPDGKVIDNAEDFATYLIEKHGLATVAGEAFYIQKEAQRKGENRMYIRVSYAASEQELERAGELLKQAVGALKIPQKGRFVA